MIREYKILKFFEFLAEDKGLHAPNEGFLEYIMVGEITGPLRPWMVLSTSCLELLDIVKHSGHVYYNYCDSL